MKHTFYLKQPKSTKESLILFSCYFKKENRKFVYSTGERIKPSSWNFENNEPYKKGKNRASNANSIKIQLDRYSNCFNEIIGICLATREEFTCILLKDRFNDEFKKSSTKKNLFFEALDTFIDEKKKLKVWKPSTAKRYTNIKNHLLKFEKEKKFKLTFNKINKRFYTEFTDYCYNSENHYSNTFARNMGLFKTFMRWAVKEKLTYNLAFNDFKVPSRVLTREEALTLEQVELIFNLDCKNEKLNKVKDLFVFQCLTGMRYGELKKVNKRTVFDNCIILKEEKDSGKPTREIPLTTISKYILKKYDFKLPIITNQKQNEYIKKVIEKAELIHDVEYTRVKGVEQEIFIKSFADRISTHTARRTFVTIMRNKNVPDKTIMSITGHTDIKTFNAYHKVNNNAKSDAVNNVFGSMELPKLMKV
ncbi:phage integrase SAM-like domain-containing protein [Joostella atrarenae]|uniref:Phage integrase SAM-like domain-containing protein n=1 Tax=Joostella atrarenae TaxID=679257 RepID=A0ABS9J7R4_9FLAO|nr:tyrosine-type recombinase/integrase [Joostella atrarenae]MCF8716466.1 phage integrase SAM-like domain-containing protein [Joostella atrarenae]